MAEKKEKATQAEAAVVEEPKTESLLTEDELTQIKEKIIAEAMKEAQEKASEIIAEAQKQAAETTSEGHAAPDTVGSVDYDAIKEHEAYMKEEVEIQLFKDGKEYKDDVFVSVNGHNYVIKRGVPVKVPRYIKEVLDNSMAQKIAANEYIEKQEQEYDKGAN